MFRSLFDKFIIKKSSIKKCSFCGCSENGKNPLIAGDNSFICSNCVCAAYKILFGEVEGNDICTNDNSVDEYDDIDFLDVIRK